MTSPVHPSGVVTVATLAGTWECHANFTAFFRKLTLSGDGQAKACMLDVDIDTFTIQAPGFQRGALPREHMKNPEPLKPNESCVKLSSVRVYALRTHARTQGRSAMAWVASALTGTERPRQPLLPTSTLYYGFSILLQTLLGPHCVVLVVVKHLLIMQQITRI